MPWVAGAMVAGSVLSSYLASRGSKKGGGGGGIGPVAVNTGAYGMSGMPDPNGGLSVALTEKDTGEKFNRLARMARTYGDLDSLRAGIRPGFGALTDARVSSVRNAASKATSNLRDSLALRRIAGSRFGDDAMASVEQAFGQQEAEARAQSVIQEIAMTQEILDQEHRYMQDEIQKNLAELGIASNFTSSILGAQATQNNVDKQLAAQSAAGQGQFFGQLAGLGASAAQSYFGGGGGAGFSRLFSGGTAANSAAQNIGLQAYTQGPTQ